MNEKRRFRKNGINISVQKPFKQSPVMKPWVEKYRPTHFNDIVLEPHNRQFFKNIIEQKTDYFPNLLLYGPPGTGKTTSILNLVSEYQKREGFPNHLGCNVIKLDASSERGVDIIRNQINLFITSNSIFTGGLKFVILDEVDYMTKSAQQTLKYILQTFSFTNVRFFLICNYISKIDESLQKEFVCVQFNQMPPQEIHAFLKTICQKENIDDRSLPTLMLLFQYDIRSMINFLQVNHELILDNQILQNLHRCIHEGTPDFMAIRETLLELSRLYNLHEKEIIKRYYDYVLLHHAKECVTSSWLDEAEIVLHNLDNPVILDMFVLLSIRRRKTT